jgi:hypothetical protein
MFHGDGSEAVLTMRECSGVPQMRDGASRKPRWRTLTGVKTHAQIAAAGSTQTAGKQAFG